MNDNRIGDLIKAMRLSRGMSQSEVAAFCGVNRSTIACWESGKRIPLVQNLEALADCFNVPISAFLEQPSAKDVRDSIVSGQDEVLAIRQSLHENPDLRVLFDLGKDCTAQELRQTIAIIKALKGESDD